MGDPMVMVDWPQPGVVRLALNRPERGNALTRPLVAQLEAAVVRAGAASDARVLVLAGRKGAFCTGMDLGEAAGVESALALGRDVRDLLVALGSSRLPTVAVVEGTAAGGGAGLVLACDFALATEGARFGFPETRRGLVPAMAGALAFRRLGDRAARELMLGGALASAEQARACGVFSRVVPEGAMDEAVAELLADLLATAPRAGAATKAWLDRLQPRPLAEVLAEAFETFARSLATGEMEEGLAAFREKRTPAWEPAPAGRERTAR